MNIIRIVVNFQLTCPKQNCPKIIKSIKQVKTVNIIGYSALLVNKVANTNNPYKILIPVLLSVVTRLP